MKGDMTVIDLGSLSENTVGTRLLSLRENGEEIRNCLVPLIMNASEKIIALDFVGVRMIDFSCSDEIVAILQENIRDLKGKRIILMNLTKSHRENIHIALKDRKQAIWIISVDGADYIGHLQGNLQNILEIVIENRKITARDLADMLGEELPNVSQKLGQLYKKGLIDRIEERSNEGMQYLYISFI